MGRQNNFPFGVASVDGVVEVVGGLRHCEEFSKASFAGWDCVAREVEVKIYC